MRRSHPKASIHRILIVEDEPLIAFDTEHFLNASGFLVIATVDAVAAALSHIEREAAPDLVITDVRLAGGDSGLDVARAAKARGIFVLFITGHRPEGAEGLAHGCLIKPYMQRDLGDAIAAIEAVTDGRKPRRVPRNFILYEGA